MGKPIEDWAEWAQEWACRTLSATTKEYGYNVSQRYSRYVHIFNSNLNHVIFLNRSIVEKHLQLFQDAVS